MKLHHYPDKSLSSICSTVAAVTEQTASDADFIRVLNGGVAIAAPQVGILERWYVVGSEACTEVVLNPVVHPVGNESVLLSEGCLSFPGCSGQVRRFCSVHLSGVKIRFSRSGVTQEVFSEVLTGLEAQIAQHECDHLNGVLYTSKLSNAERSRIHGTVRKLRKNKKI